MAKKAAKKKAPAKKVAKRIAKKKAAPARRAAPARKAAAPRKASYKPEDHGDVVANLVFKESAKAIDFYKQAFGAKELRRMPSPDGKGIWHAELRIGDSVIFLNDESPMGGTVAATPDHRATSSLQIYAPDCDALFQRAVAAGAKPSMPVADMFWGDRMGMVTDPFGQQWAISTRVKVLTDEQMRKGGEEFAKQFAAQMAKQGGQPQGAQQQAAQS
jgi:uncharacterized glyoxalase superfamily protein PhnB